MAFTVHPRSLIPVLLFAAGAGLIGLAVVEGDADVSLFLIFPVFSGSSGTFALGTALVLLGFISGFALLALGQAEAFGTELQGTPSKDRSDGERSRPRYGGVILIGPVPIAFGSDQKVALAMLVIGIVLAIVLLGVLLLLA